MKLLNCQEVSKMEFLKQLGYTDLDIKDIKDYNYDYIEECI